MPWTLPRLSRFLLTLLSTAALLATSACKPEHEIGKVQYDSLVTWTEMFKDGRQGVRKYLGKTVTINELVMLNTDRVRETPNGDECGMRFSMTFKTVKDLHKVLPNSKYESICPKIYFNWQPEVSSLDPESMGLDFDSLLRASDSGIQHLPLPQNLCSECKSWDTFLTTEKQEWIPSQSTDTCLLQSRKLHVTGKIIALEMQTGPGLTLHIVPTGIAW